MRQRCSDERPKTLEPRHGIECPSRNERYWQSDTSSPRVSKVMERSFEPPAQFEYLELERGGRSFSTVTAALIKSPRANRT